MELVNFCLEKEISKLKSLLMDAKSLKILMYMDINNTLVSMWILYKDGSIANSMKSLMYVDLCKATSKGNLA